MLPPRSALPGRALAAAALLLSGALLAAAPAGPAWADDVITSPEAGAVVAEHGVVAIRASIRGEGPSELRLRAPGAAEGQVVAAGAGFRDLAHDMDTRCAPAPCTGPSPARNGTWTALVSGAASAEREFVVRIPPAVPDSVGAAQAEDGPVVVTWRKGDEPDLTGWLLRDAAGTALSGRIGPEACAEAVCRVSVAGADPEQRFAVQARRATCPDCTDELSSAPSEAVAAGEGAPVDLSAGAQPAPPPEPEPDPTTSATTPPDSQASGPARTAAPAPRGGSTTSRTPGRIAAPLRIPGAPAPRTSTLVERVEPEIAEPGEGEEQEQGGANAAPLLVERVEEPRDAGWRYAGGGALLLASGGLWWFARRRPVEEL